MKLSRFVRDQCRELFRHDEWNIGVVEAPQAAFLDSAFQPAVRWLPAAGRGAYRADPFGLGAAIFCEEYSYGRDLGSLVAIEGALEGDGAARPLRGFPALHLSYPYLIESAGEVYCVPEMWQGREIRLYRATAFPAAWEHAATLARDFAGVDSTVFRHGGRWWLACTNRDTDPDRDLWLFHAPALEGPWTPHRRNPVKSDLSSSRPAGTPFEHGGHLYRPAQDCAATYGGAVVLNRVLRLDPEEFREEAAARVAPRPEWPWPSGLHTLSAWGERTLLDAKRVRFAGPAFRRVLRRKLRRLAGLGRHQEPDHQEQHGRPAR